MKTLMESLMTGNKSRFLWHAVKIQLREHMNPRIDKDQLRGFMNRVMKGS
jgi:hypothetical protein